MMLDFAWPADYWPEGYWSEYWPDYGEEEPPATIVPLVVHHLKQQEIG